MGGRGSYSFSGKTNKERTTTSGLKYYATGSLNTGTAGGTSVAVAVDRFRTQMMDEKVEYSAYVDDAGYVHALASSGRAGSTGVVSFTQLKNEPNVTTVIHNHPDGDGRAWGGPLSSADYRYITGAYEASGGKINTMVATSREGTYTARVTRNVSTSEINNAVRRANSSLRGHTFTSEIGMWREVNAAYTREFKKIGVETTFTAEKPKHGTLVTQRIG